MSAAMTDALAERFYAGRAYRDFAARRDAVQHGLSPLHEEWDAALRTIGDEVAVARRTFLADHGLPFNVTYAGGFVPGAPSFATADAAQAYVGGHSEAIQAKSAVVLAPTSAERRREIDAILAAGPWMTPVGQRIAAEIGAEIEREFA